MKKSKLALLLATVVTLGFMGCEQPHEHSWDAGTITKEPTCTEKGKRGFKCTDTECSEEWTEDIAANGHHAVGDWLTSDDTHWKMCGECGEKSDEVEHNFIHKGNCWRECECGEKKAVSLDALGTYDSIKMTFGVYPQTIKSSDVTVDKTVKNNEISGADYYLGSDGAWYAECVENSSAPWDDQFNYSDGSIVAEKNANSKKYFKVKPIEWVYLAETKCLHAKKILTANVMWDEEDNNYKNSNIRSWLNGTFYDSAFTENQKKKIKTTTVDNSAASTTDAGNNITQVTDYACEDTQDKIFLLSEKEATTEGNGFTAYNVYGTGNSRARFPTDYALANYCDQGYSFDGDCEWWLRSPLYSDRWNDVVSIIRRKGANDGNWGASVANKGIGVVPALAIEE